MNMCHCLDGEVYWSERRGLMRTPQKAVLLIVGAVVVGVPVPVPVDYIDSAARDLCCYIFSQGD